MTASQCPNVWNRFFHSRVGATGIWISGWMRIGFAFLYLADRILWSLDVAEFLAPQTGLLPYIQQQQQQQQQQQNIHKTLEWNLFGLAPTHQGWFYGLFYIGILQSVLLLLGIAPRFQLVCLHLNTVSWTHHNYLCFDYQDDMMRMWGFGCYFCPRTRLPSGTGGDTRRLTSTIMTATPYGLFGFGNYRLPSCTFNPVFVS